VIALTQIGIEVQLRIIDFQAAFAQSCKRLSCRREHAITQACNCPMVRNNQLLAKIQCELMISERRSTVSVFPPTKEFFPQPPIKYSHDLKSMNPLS